MLVAISKQVSHPQVGENRTALFPVLVLFWHVGGRGVMRVTYSVSERDGQIERERGRDKYKYREYKRISA